MSKELIERLEKAEAGSRELDGAVWYAVFEPDVEHGCLHVEKTEQGDREALTCELGSKWADDVGNYTTSLDAALALAERVLPGWIPSLEGSRGGRWLATISLWESEGSAMVRFGHAHAPTPALALVTAILKTQGAQQ